MRLDPELAEIAAQLPPVDMEDIVAARAGMARLVAARRAGLPDDWDRGVTIVERSVPGAEGDPDITVLVVTPTGAVPPGGRGGLVYLHGGAFMLGDADGSLPLCAAYARDADLVVVDVDYRLAPEHPFPAGVTDARAVTAWAAACAGELGIDPARLGVGGASAGGALAAAVALSSRDGDGPPLAYQLLVYPVLDDRMTTTSVRAFTDVPVWTARSTAVMWRAYLAGWEGPVPPAAAPARATDLTGLPPTFLLSCEYDPLRDEDLDYARRLLEAGVTVEIHQFPGTFHGYDGMGVDVSRRTYQLEVGALAAALGGATTG